MAKEFGDGGQPLDTEVAAKRLAWAIKRKDWTAENFEGLFGMMNALWKSKHSLGISFSWRGVFTRVCGTRKVCYNTSIIK